MRGVLLSILLITSSVFAADWTLESISVNPDTMNYNLKFVNSKKEVQTLVDDDGMATLAVMQKLLIQVIDTKGDFKKAAAQAQPIILAALDQAGRYENQLNQDMSKDLTVSQEQRDEISESQREVESIEDDLRAKKELTRQNFERLGKWLEIQLGPHNYGVKGERGQQKLTIGRKTPFLNGLLVDRQPSFNSEPRHKSRFRPIKANLEELSKKFLQSKADAEGGLVRRNAEPHERSLSSQDHVI